LSVADELAVADALAVADVLAVALDCSASTAKTAVEITIDAKILDSLMFFS
jgi:hypothetical protein